jgi:hypothetical protein
MSYISAIENLAEQLKNMGEAPTLLQITTKIIYTLPPHLRGFITTWESLPEEEQTIPLLTSKILNEESKNAMFQPQGTVSFKKFRTKKSHLAFRFVLYF